MQLLTQECFKCNVPISYYSESVLHTDNRIYCFDCYELLKQHEQDKESGEY